MNDTELRHNGSKALLDYWNALRADRAAPWRAEITPAGLGRLLTPHVFILEALSSGATRLRLSGAALHDIFGLELRGMEAAAAMEAEHRAQFLSLIRETLEKPGFAVMNGRMRPVSGAAAPLEAELVMLPLRSDFGRLDRVIGAVHLLSEEPVSPAARRFQVTSTSFQELPETTFQAEALPGFAEPSATAFTGRSAEKKKPQSFRERRRDHLRVVRD